MAEGKKEKAPVNAISLKVETFDRTVNVEIKSSDMGTAAVADKARELLRDLMGAEQ